MYMDTAYVYICICSTNYIYIYIYVYMYRDITYAYIPGESSGGPANLCQIPGGPWNIPGKFLEAPWNGSAGLPGGPWKVPGESLEIPGGSLEGPANF